MMATPFYEVEMSAPSPSSCMYDKKNLKLDFSNIKREKGPDSSTAVLTTPDLKMLQLASPDLEKFIISNYGTNSGLTPTITPLLFSKSAATVTEEQEIYARGFLEALQRLHQQEELVNAGVNTDEQKQIIATTANSVTQHTVPGCNAVISIPTVSNVSTLAKPYTQLSTISTEATRNLSLLSGYANFTGSLAAVSTSTATNTRHCLPTTSTVVIPDLSVLKAENPLQAIHAESQGVSRPPSFVVKSESEQIVPTMTPINLQQQEMFKNERKRQRNREAAAKCRLRKIHREQELESKVKVLKKRKSELNDQAVKLRQEVCTLKQRVMEHINGGCTIMLQCQPQGLEMFAGQTMDIKQGIAVATTS